MRRLYFLLSAALLLGSCKKDDPEASLPRISQEGLNTGGFLIDGVAYPATGWSGSLWGIGGPTDALQGGYAVIWPGLRPNNDFELRINSRQADRYATVTLFLRNPRRGEFPFNRTTGLPPAAADSTIFDHATVSFRTGNGELYTTSAGHTGRVVLARTDRSTGLTAGTFEFTAVSNLDPSKALMVKAGRFDRKQ